MSAANIAGILASLSIIVLAWCGWRLSRRPR